MKFAFFGFFAGLIIGWMFVSICFGMSWAEWGDSAWTGKYEIRFLILWTPAILAFAIAGSLIGYFNSTENK